MTTKDYDDKIILDYLELKYQKSREMFVDHVLELFFLEQQGHFMDYYSWRKKPPTVALLQHLKDNIAESDEDFEQLQSIKASLDSVVCGTNKTVTPIISAAELALVPPHVSPFATLPLSSSNSAVTSRPTTTPLSSSFSAVKSSSVISVTTSIPSQPSSVSSVTTAATTASSISATSSVPSTPVIGPAVATSVIPSSTISPSPPVPVVSTSESLPSSLSLASSTVSITPSTPISPLITPTTPLKSSSISHARTTSLSSSSSNLTISTRKQLNKQHSIASVFDNLLGSSEDGAIRAKQEAIVMNRIAELRKEGLWSAKRLPKVQEPPRAKAHWDYLLEEMVWLATDFAQERKWKKTAAKKCARMVMKYHQDKCMQAEKAEKEEIMRLRRIAAAISKEIRSFWSNVEKLVEYRQQTRLEEKRKKALDLHLNFIVDQTEKFSSWLAAGMTQPVTSAATSVQDGSDDGSTADMVASLKQSNVESDQDFEPQKSSESDDEETIAKDEEEYGTDDNKSELDLLKKESNMPIEEILGSSAEDTKVDSVKTHEEESIKKQSEKDHTSRDDEDFKIESAEDEEDDEETIDEQEKQEKNIDYTAEIKELENEANLSVDELIEKYKSIIDQDALMSSDSDNDERDGSTGISEDDDTPKDESDIETENEEEMLTGDESETEELGMESLLETDSQNNGKSLIEVVSDDKSESSPDKAIADVAAGAESIKPKGFTLSTANVVTKVPFLLKHKLREYQHIGLDWLVAMCDKKLNGILADEMGLGKTIQTISLLAHLAVEKGIWGPHLIVVPTSVMLNWEMEFKKWCPAFKILTYYGNPKERKAKRQGWTKPNKFHVCITSYKLVIQDHQAFRRKKWKYLILDEAQHIKNFKSLRWQMLLNFNSSRRLLLTGTPLQNNLMELWSLMHFLMPNVFASHRDFKDWFVNPVTGMIEGNTEYNEGIIRRLHKLLRPFLLRRIKDEVEKQLPKKIEHVIRTRLSKRQRYLYEEFMSLTKTKETLASGNFLSVINVLMQLRKVCNHPNLFEPRPITSPFAMEGLTYHTASLATTPLNYDPLKNVNLDVLNLRFINYSIPPNSVSAIAQHRIGEYQATPKLIEEIDSSPEPPPRIPKGKLRLHINIKTSVSLSSAAPQSQLQQKGFQLQTRTLPTVQMKSINNIPLIVCSAQTSTTQTNAVQGHRFLLLSTQPANSAVTPLRTSSSIGNSGVIVTDNSSHINMSGPSGGSIVKKLTLAKSVPGTVQSNALSNQRIKIPIGKLLQTSSGQHILVNPVQASSITSSSPIVIPGNVNIASNVTPVRNIIAEKQKISDNVLSSKKSDGISIIENCRPKTLQERKLAERREKLCWLGRLNARRCSATALYAPDLIQISTITSHPSQICKEPKSGSSTFNIGQGYFHCMHNQLRSRRPADYFYYTDCLTNILKTPEDLVNDLYDILTRYVLLVPRVSSPRIQMHVSHPSPWKVQEEKNLVQKFHKELSPKCDFLHPIISNFRTQFPELRLIQYDCGKLQKLDELLYELKQGGHRVLIFTQMSRMLDIFEQFLNYHGHTYLRLDGSTKIEQRQALMERFNADKRIFCFILSTRSGGIGVNLTGADTVIFYDSDWNPTMDAQAQDRCHRIGQTRDVHIYRLISEKTVEENILKKAKQKRLLGDVAIEGGNFTTAFFKKEAITELFGIDIPEVKSESTEKVQQSITTDKSAENVVNSNPEENTQVLVQLEQALGTAEEASDVAAARTARAEAAAEYAEFDESIPLETEGKDGEEKSAAEEELDRLIEQLTPVERYAMQFLESVQEPITSEQLKQAEEEIEAHKKEWELGHLKSLKAEKERAAGEIDSDQDDILTMPREEACQVYVSYNTNGMEQMPVWTPPTPPQDSNDLYIDYSMVFNYETSTMPESQVPPIYVAKENKRLKLDHMALARNKQHKLRKDEIINIPRALFDNPLPIILKLRRELRIQKLKGMFIGGPDLHRLQKTLLSIGANGNLPQPPTLAQQAANSKQPQVYLQGLQYESQIHWSINEDWAILQVIQFHQELCLNLLVLSPGQIPNWDLVSEAVNSEAFSFRSPKLCRHHYESVVLQREEGKLLHDPSPKKSKKLQKASALAVTSAPSSPASGAPAGQTIPTPKPSQGRPMRTSHIYLQDGNYSFTQLCNARFETIKQIANKKQPTVKLFLSNSTGKNPKHIALLGEYGINYEQPLTPMQIAQNRLERVAKEKAKTQQQVAEQQLFSEAQKQLARQKQQQLQRQVPVNQLLQQSNLVQRPQQVAQNQTQIFAEKSPSQPAHQQPSPLPTPPSPSSSHSQTQQVSQVAQQSQGQIIQLKQQHPNIKTVFTGPSITLQPSQQHFHQQTIQAKVTAINQNTVNKAPNTQFVMTNFAAANNPHIAKALNQLVGGLASQSQQSNSSIGQMSAVLPQTTRITASTSSGTVTIPIAAVQGIVSGAQTQTVSVLSSQSSGTVLSVTALPPNQNQKILAAAIIPSNQVNPQVTGANITQSQLQQVFKSQLLLRQQQQQQQQSRQLQTPQVVPVQQIQLQKPQQQASQTLTASLTSAQPSTSQQTLQTQQITPQRHAIIQQQATVSLAGPQQQSQQHPQHQSQATTQTLIQTQSQTQQQQSSQLQQQGSATIQQLRFIQQPWTQESVQDTQEISDLPKIEKMDDL